jgi:hypothetical protein
MVGFSIPLRVAISTFMSKLTALLVVAALGFAISSSAEAPYVAAANQMAIQQLPTEDLFKQVMAQEAMFEASQEPQLPRGMQIVLPQTGRELSPTLTLT